MEYNIIKINSTELKTLISEEAKKFRTKKTLEEQRNKVVSLLKECDCENNNGLEENNSENTENNKNSRHNYNIPGTRLSIGRFGTSEVALTLDNNNLHRVAIYRGSIPELIKALQKIENGELIPFS